MNNKRQLYIAIVAVISLILITTLVSYAFFSYSKNGTKENIITSGDITFLYTENENVGNGINIIDALPMPDSYGKKLSTYFDFKVTSSSGKSQIPYEITLRKTKESDALDEYMKVYLTKTTGSDEEEKVLSMYNDLSNSTNSIAALNNEKTLYTSFIPAGAKNYVDNYRLRMWLNDNQEDGPVLSYDQTTTYKCSDTTYQTEEACLAAEETWQEVTEAASIKTFTIKVNVYANGKVANQEEIASADSTEISDINIAGVSAQANNDSSLNYDYLITTTNNPINLDVAAANPNAKVTITEYNPTAMNTNIRRLSASNNFQLKDGDNYFKITITSANKAKTKEYILKVIKEKSHDATLSSLNIEDCTLNELFSSSRYTYSCTTEESSITPVYQTSNNGATVSISGNNIQNGVNTVTITVTAEDGTTTQPYIIAVTGVNVTKKFSSNASVGDYIDFPYNGTTGANGSSQAVKFQKAGQYKIELWGAQGYNASSAVGNYTGGKGAYTTGIIRTNTNQRLYIYVGGTGVKASDRNRLNGGYNGGGGSVPADGSSFGGAGGGATDVRYFDSLPNSSQLAWNSSIGLASRIMVAGGGGGAGSASPGTAPYAGGLIGGKGTVDYRFSASSYPPAQGGSQTAGGSISSCGDGYCSGDFTPGAFGAGGNGSTGGGFAGGAGGSGYYGGGGGASGYAFSGAGGSSFISGYQGCVAIKSASDTTPRTASDNTTICTEAIASTDSKCSEHYSGLVFTSTQMIAGNESMPSPTGGTETGHSGNGYARITYLGD